MNDHPIILFDGICNLCNGWVNFVIDRDRSRNFRFAALQSEVGGRLCENRAHDIPDSIVLIENDVVHVKSDAVLRIARQLDGAWPLLALFRLVPRSVRDLVYDFVARHRYRWFGKRDTCRVPTPDLQSRFL